MSQRVRPEVAGPMTGKDDRAHLMRWTADHYPGDPIWERLAAAARERGLLPLDGIYESIIREALYCAVAPKVLGLASISCCGRDSSNTNAIWI
jgi:hypothetical protein